MAAVTDNRNFFKWRKLVHFRMKWFKFKPIALIYADEYIHFKIFHEICNFDNQFFNIQISPIVFLFLLLNGVLTAFSGMLANFLLHLPFL